MCVEVEINGKWVDCVGDLRAAVKGELVKEACYAAMPPDGACLCGIDIEATAKRHNMMCRQNEAFDWILETTEPRQESIGIIPQFNPG
jgi:hypothetical protein